MIKKYSKLPSRLHFKTDSRLLTVNFSMDDIAKIQQNLDCSKAHGHVKTIIFKQSMGSGSFPSEWKKGNVVRIHEKEDKQCLKNYHCFSAINLWKIF